MALPQPGKVYTLAGDTPALYNGARDTDGGIWVRFRDENDRRILGAAVKKQRANQSAATGTLTALDPNAGHLVDYVGEALDRVADAINGARPADMQLDGTPIGAELAKNGTAGTDGADGTEKKGRGRKGGTPTKVGDVLARVPGSPLADPANSSGGVAGTAPGDGSDIQWADSIPKPRPRLGDVIRTPEGHATAIVKLVGYDVIAGAFHVVDAGGWDGLVTAGPKQPGERTDGVEWYMMARLLDYPERERAAEPAAEPSTEPSTIAQAAETPVEFPADALGGATAERVLEDGPPADVAPDVDAGAEPYAPDAEPDEPTFATATIPTPPQRQRNAKSAGVARAEPPRAAKKAAKKGNRR